MRNDHLTDEVLQAIVLHEIQDKEVVSHLSGCSICQNKVEAYQLIIDGLAKMPFESFSFDVSSIVMVKIHAAEAKKDKSTEIIFFTALCGIVLVLGMAIYPYLQPLINQFRATTFMANALLVMSVMGVVGFLVKDLLRQYNLKELAVTQ